MHIEDFIASGYIKYNQTGFRENAELLLQKRIYDVIGTKYFINTYFYKFPESKEVFDAEVQFTKKGCTYNIHLMDFDSIGELEKCFEELWEEMCFDYYND